MNILRRNLLGTALALSTFTAAQAQGRPPAEGLQVGIGAGTIIAPRSIGSDKTRYLVVPTVDVRYGDWFFANPVDGIGVQTRVYGVTASAALAPDFNSREPEAGARYQGLSRVSPTAAARFKLDYEFNDFTASAVLSSRLSSTKRRGTTMTFEGGYNFIDNQRLTFNAGLTARVMDNLFARNLLSVSADDAATSGLPVYRARRGLLDAGVYGQAVYRFDDRWPVFGPVGSRATRG